MRLSSPLARVPTPANEDDPREGMSAEVIDLASRSAFPAVARKGKSDALGLAAGVGVVALLGAVTLWSMDTARQGTVEATGAPAPQNTPVAAPPAPAQAAVEQPEPAVPVAAPQADPAPRAVLARPPLAGPQIVPSNPYTSPTVVYDGGSAPSIAGGIAAAAAAAGAPEPSQPYSGGGGSAGEFAARVGGMGGGTATATATFDPATTVTQGTLIPAVLETAIDTDVPGFVRAVVSTDVRSYDGTRVLVPRSSRLVGQYQSGLQAGQKRAYVIWTRLIRPDGVSVDLASPGTGFDGSGGLPGKVDNHFFKRFGSAMLLSVVGGLAAIGSGGASVVLGGGQSAAATALQQDGNIAPTVRVRQGEPIRVFTARDLDFGQVQ